MNPEAGRLLAHYRLDEKIGEGGMGVVWKATDTSLGRSVAVKILPELFSEDPDRLARFEREAKLLASLNHPNIAVIHGLHRAEGLHFLAMELVHGEDLARRLSRGALPVEEAIAVARQVAEALEAAHEAGVIHRDLKPANIQVGDDGKVKVLDFGLAKAFEADTRSGSPSLSPTLTSAGTRAGMILGTAAFMSPEQARGRPVDRRADIWAFGCVVYEMLTGQPAFPGETISDTIAGVLKSEPDWSALPPDTPPRLAGLMKRCLRKDPRERLRDIGDARLELSPAALSEPAASTAAPAATAAPAPPHRAFAWAGLALGLIAGALGTYAAVRFFASPAPVRVTRTSIVLPPGTTLDTDNASIALSPDGTRLAYAGREKGGAPRLFVRPLDSLTPQPLAGTDGASYPFWSPDGRVLGFFAGGKLKKVPSAGGTVVSICDSEDGRGASWGAGDDIVFSPGPYSALFQVHAAGGTPEALTKTKNDKETHRNPRFLPDGRRVLYFSGRTAGDKTNGIYALDLKTRKSTQIVSVDSEGIYAEPGYLAFVRDGNLLAQRIDPATLKLAGEAMPIAEDVQFNTFRYTGTYSFSGTGLLLYQNGAIQGLNQLTWYDLDGNRLKTVGEPALFWLGMGISPDGRRAVTAVRHADGGADLWMYDFARGLGSRFTLGETDALVPVWSPDGRQVAFCDGGGTLYVKAADGATPSRKVYTVEDASMLPTSWFPDGSRLLYFSQSTRTGLDLWTLNMTGDPKPVPFLTGPANEAFGQFSPDGRWVTLVSNESGRNELYLASYPGPGGKWQISTGGAETGGWITGKEVWFRDPEGRFFAVTVSLSGAGVELEAPRPLLGGRAEAFESSSFTPDGTRLLAAVPVAGDAGPALTLVTDWAAELGKR